MSLVVCRHFARALGHPVALRLRRRFFPSCVMGKRKAPEASEPEVSDGVAASQELRLQAATCFLRSFPQSILAEASPRDTMPPRAGAHPPAHFVVLPPSVSRKCHYPAQVRLASVCLGELRSCRFNTCGLRFRTTNWGSGFKLGASERRRFRLG